MHQWEKGLQNWSNEKLSEIFPTCGRYASGQKQVFFSTAELQYLNNVHLWISGVLLEIWVITGF